MSYIAVGSGSKQENRAMVYAGHYSAHFFLPYDVIVAELTYSV